MGGFPIQRSDIRLAILGMVDGNGHPYSWSAIFNGYDPEEMAKCPFPVIPIYLAKEPSSSFGILGAKVTHIWTDDAADAERVARAALIPNVLSHPEEAIGQVDAVIIPTDKGHEHVSRARPFIEAELPVFIDKPLVDNAADLKTFMAWIAEGKPILSSSCMRYAKEYMPYRASTRELGEVRLATITTPKSWERYGIHALEGIYPIFGPGFISARNSGSSQRNIVHFRHECGADIVVAAVDDLYGAFGVLGLYGTAGHVKVAFADTFYAFKKQLEGFVHYLLSGVPPFPFSETVELMKMVIASIQSREEQGREVFLAEIGRE
jgi:predicted dehydrogenase